MEESHLKVIPIAFLILLIILCQYFVKYNKDEKNSSEYRGVSNSCVCLKAVFRGPSSLSLSFKFALLEHVIQVPMHVCRSLPGPGSARFTPFVLLAIQEYKFIG